MGKSDNAKKTVKTYFNGAIAIFSPPEGKYMAAGRGNDA